MTLARWLEHREPAPPPALAERLQSLLAPYDDADDPTEAMLAAAECLIERLLHDRTASRVAALDLLAVDALVTYAFELASDEPEGLERRADDAMHRIAMLVAVDAA